MSKNDAELEKDQTKKKVAAEKSRSEVQADKSKDKSDSKVASEAKVDKKIADAKSDVDKASKADKSTVKEPEAKISAEDNEDSGAELKSSDAKVDANKPESSDKTIASSAKKGSSVVTSTKTVVTKHKKSIVIIGAAALSALLLTVIVFGVLIYGYQSDAPAVKVVAGVVPYPVERVNGGLNFVPYSAYLFEVDANKRAIQNNASLNKQPAVDFKSADGKKQLLEVKKHVIDKLKADALTAQLARKYKVSVSSKEVDTVLNQFYERYDGKSSVIKTLKKDYGWTLDDFKSVIRKQLLSKKLEEAVAADPTINAQVKAKVDAVAKKLKAAEDFAATAKANSDASDAANGGDLGAFTKSQVPEEIQKALAATPVGAVSDPVKTQYGYEIIKVNSKDGDNYTASHILVKSVDYDTWFNDQLKKAKVNVYIVVK